MRQAISHRAIVALLAALTATACDPEPISCEHGDATPCSQDAGRRLLDTCTERCRDCLTEDACLGHCGGPADDCIRASASCGDVIRCVSGPPPDAG